MDKISLLSINTSLGKEGLYNYLASDSYPQVVFLVQSYHRLSVAVAACHNANALTQATPQASNCPKELSVMVELIVRDDYRKKQKGKKPRCRWPVVRVKWVFLQGRKKI